MAEESKRRTQTSPGLGHSGDSGHSGLRPRHVMPSTPSTPSTPTTPTTPTTTESRPPVSGVRDHDAAQDSFSGDVPLERAEKISTRRARTSRPPIRVDAFGDAAVAIASKAVDASAPKLLKTRSELTHAPIDHRDAFVLSHIDGKMSVQAIVDVAGMPASEILGILERLARLGIVALP